EKAVVRAAHQPEPAVALDAERSAEALRARRFRGPARIGVRRAIPEAGAGAGPRAKIAFRRPRRADCGAEVHQRLRPVAGPFAGDEFARQPAQLRLGPW